MSDIVTATRTYLLTQSGVTDLVVDRIYFDNLPQGATLPAVVVDLAGSEVSDRHLVATGSLYRSQVNLYLYADTHTALAALGDAVYAAMEFKSGTWGTVTVKHSFVEQTHDVTDTPRDGSEAFRPVRGHMCVVWHA